MEKYEALLDGTYELPEALYTGLGDLKRVAYSSAMEVFLPATSATGAICTGASALSDDFP